MLDIYFSFQNILSENQSVDFINTFFGLPIQNKGRLVRLGEEGHLFVSVPAAQVVGMQSNHNTHMKNELFPSVVKARVVEASLPAGLVELADFEYSDDSIGKRRSIRVEPEEPIKVTVIPEEKRQTTTPSYGVDIVEISIEGLSVIIDRTYYDAKTFGKEKKVFIRYHLPIAEGQMTIVSYEGIIRNIVLGKKCRIGIEVFPDSGIKLTIAKYIAYRREQLLKKIEKISVSKGT
jgi:hypothetical protein